MGRKVAQATNFPVTLTQEDFTKNAKFSVRPRRCGQAGRSPRQWTPLGALGGHNCWREFPRINSLCGSDVYRIHELATTSKYASPFHLWRCLGFGGKAKVGEVALRNFVFSRMAGCSLWGPG